MLNYLEKFNNLPQELREKISDPAVMQKISEIEKKYDLTLAMVVMRVMVGDISIVDLPKYFVFEHDMDGRKAEKLVDDLKNEVFFSVAEYLGFSVRESETQAGESRKEDADDWMEKKKKEAAARGSSFFFSSEDEEEIQELTKKVEGFASGEKIETQEDVDAKNEKKIAEVKKQLGVNFSSEELSSRFGQILKTYLKGVRNRIDTRQTFMKKVEHGGLGMDGIFTDNILLLADSPELEEKIKKENSQLELSGGQFPGQENPAKIAGKPLQNNDFSFNLGAARDIDYDFSKMPNVAGEKKPQEQKIADGTNASEIPVFELGSKPGNGKEIVAEPSKKIEITKYEDEIPRNSEIKGLSLGADMKNTKMATPDVISLKEGKPQDGRKKIVDVKHVPKLVGPIDELSEMSLLNFRRLDDDPREAALKMKEKLKFLEEDSYAQRLSGIKAWRRSPLNNLYLRIGSKSIAEKKTVSQIVKEMMDSGKDYLTENEFKAVMDLNRSIRF